MTAVKDGPYQLAAVWEKGAKEAWLVVSDLPDPTILPRIYAKRWAIESTFRDLKSYGFDLEASRIKDMERFNRLLIGITLAYGWAARIGHSLDQSGQRHLVDRGTKDKLSVYRMGRDWLLVRFASPWGTPLGSGRFIPQGEAKRSLPQNTTLLMYLYTRRVV